MGRLILNVLLWGVPAVAALLCVAGMWLWIVTIPGDPNSSYAEPWIIGLVSLIAYPASIALIFALMLIAFVVKLPIRTRHFQVAAWLALGAFILVQGVVWVWLIFYT